MKYLFTILAFVLLSTAVTIYFLWPSNMLNSQHAALSINGHQISQSRVDDQQRLQGYHSEDMGGSIDAMVTKQVLLDEAQRLGIDREVAFRKSLKDYYEQSLIRVLTDRKLKSISVSVSEQDIEQYLSCSGKIFTFTRIPMEKGITLKGQSRQNSVLFDDLSESLRLVLATLQPGEEIVQFETGTEVGVVLLDKIEKVEGFAPVLYERSRVRELLSDYQKSLEIDRWINSLLKKASVIVYEKEGKDE